jgi:hypothetical protein
MSANRFPMQSRVPPPNGKYEYSGKAGEPVAGEALRVERLRTREPAAIALDDPRAEVQLASDRNRDAARATIGLDRDADDDPRRRVEPERLRENARDVRQPSENGGTGRVASEHLVDLRANARLHLRVTREQVPGPGEPRSDRLVTGHEEHACLVDQLALVQGCSIGALSRHEGTRADLHREHRPPVERAGRRGARRRFSASRRGAAA